MVSTGRTYAEALPIPLLAAGAAVAVAATFGVAIGAAFGLVWGLASGAVVVGATVWLLARATGRVSVTDGELHAGRASLPAWARGAVTALDAEAARRLRGVDADPRAYLYLLGWVPTAVRVDVTDPSDPAPYWYVSTRQPEALVAALTEAASEGD